jgi:regulator of RNase E activity RraB
MTDDWKLEQNLIDTTVLELMRLSEKFSGEYDGWETPVITQ